MGNVYTQPNTQKYTPNAMKKSKEGETVLNWGAEFFNKIFNGILKLCLSKFMGFWQVEISKDISDGRRGCSKSKKCEKMGKVQEKNDGSIWVEPKALF